MSALTVREYRPEDREGFGLVRSFTYRGGDPVLANENLLRPDCTGYVAEATEGIVGAFTVLDFQMCYWHSHLRCAGVAAVAVMPEDRRSGVGSDMMTQSLPILREAGYDIAALYAFREHFYRRFGYEAVGRKYQITVPEYRLPKIEPELKVKRLPHSSASSIIPCYERFASSYNGAFIRSEDQWWRVLGGDTPMTVYAAGDPVESYVIVRLDGEFWTDQQVKEVAWSSGRGYLAAISLIASLGINKTSMSWSEPGDSPYLASFDNQGTKACVQRPLMVRVLNLESCLKRLNPAESGELTLQVVDPYIPANDGCWRIEFGDEGVTVARHASGELKLDVRTLSQAVMGDPSFDELVAGGRIEGSPDALARASMLFGSCRVYCPDMF